MLTAVDRTMIEVRLADGFGIRAIARYLGRSPGTVCDEIRRHGGIGRHLAQAARRHRQLVVDGIAEGAMAEWRLATGVIT